MEQTRRDTVIELLCAGHRPAAIIKLLQVPQEDGLRHHQEVGGVRDIQEEGAQA
ncbi:Uncharacterized protein FKW44_024472 [Caligus rogercresseyi]|uniref:Uncharacterized protein n=1 Tax=Caligus rogercresseyi TaxID=217165 RepID=A0A7T8GMS3_CALRO|nr:Uncharacterized protein FKW44_024684 [Caligus rogercresseyi]QQP33182.1 Uncharacterized protein FKW44_024472 [Caligus rogercresseyi]